ncbi:hypothetical protein C7C56_000705 [Massilia glaciei]|uniref:Solute-binding protein family 3/N-terminal domain-containing protein n=2 Tax=Massilia glaciei TaxID=1524097 RepID=A0A2U2I7F2_9BURK|nr:hypothetical protein C7C56_000705 [Massilia glaciei]
MDERAADDYGFKVLELALSKSGIPYSLTVSKLKMNQERAGSMLEQGVISVWDAGASAELETRYKAVNFPIDRGLSGYRLFLINKEQLGDFAKIRTLGALKNKRAGQGPGWGDTKILNGAGIHVRTAEFEPLFRLLNAKRIDFFPLGAEEIFTLLERHRGASPDLVVEPDLALHYPFARLFFVRKGNMRLHDAIHSGLVNAFADGSFQRLLESDKKFHDGVSRAKLRTRTIFMLDNANLTRAFRLMPKEYFYTP